MWDQRIPEFNSRSDRSQWDPRDRRINYDIFNPVVLAYDRTIYVSAARRLRGSYDPTCWDRTGRLPQAGDPTWDPVPALNHNNLQKAIFFVLLYRYSSTRTRSYAIVRS